MDVFKIRICVYKDELKYNSNKKFIIIKNIIKGIIKMMEIFLE